MCCSQGVFPDPSPPDSFLWEVLAFSHAHQASALPLLYSSVFTSLSSWTSYQNSSRHLTLDTGLLTEWNSPIWLDWPASKIWNFPEHYFPSF